MRKVMDYEHGFFGLWSPGGVCRVRIYAEEGRVPVVVLTELPKNRNTSVSNLVECLAAEVQERHEFLRGPEDPPFLLLLHHPRSEEEELWGIKPSYCSVTFSSYDAERHYSYPMANHGRKPPHRLKLGTPTFVRLDPKEALSLVGEEF